MVGWKNLRLQQTLIPNCPLEKNEKKINTGVSQNEKNIQPLNFVSNPREKRKEMRDQMFTPMPEPLADRFPKLLAVNLIIKMGKEKSRENCQSSMTTMLNVSTIWVISGII